MHISEVRPEDVFKVHTGKIMPGGGYTDCGAWFNPGYLDALDEIGCIYDPSEIDLTQVKRVLRQVQDADAKQSGVIEVQNTHRGVTVFAHNTSESYRWVFVCN
jgi:hypothetical protein